jgi:hypothetical protein
MKRATIDQVLAREAEESKIWYLVEELAVRWHLSEKRVRQLLEPHRARCHKARRGRHPRLSIWIPREVVLLMDKERMDFTKPAA